MRTLFVEVFLNLTEFEDVVEVEVELIKRALYESLQIQHQKERELWEGKLKVSLALLNIILKRNYKILRHPASKYIIIQHASHSISYYSKF